MFLLLYQAGFGQFAFELAEDLLLGKALPPEVDKRVDLIVSRHRLDTLAPLTVELIDQHFNEPSHVLIPAQGRGGGGRGRPALAITILLLLLRLHKRMMIMIMRSGHFVLLSLLLACGVVRAIFLHLKQFDSGASVLDLAGRLVGRDADHLVLVMVVFSAALCRQVGRL